MSAEKSLDSALSVALAEGTFTFTGELEPARSTDVARLIKAARKVKGSVVACNVPDNCQSMGRLSSIAASHIIERETGVETVCHLRCSDRNRLALQSDLLGAWALGLRNVLAITGDHTSLGDLPGTMPVYDLDSTQLVDMISRMDEEGCDLEGNPIEGPPRLFVGVAANPNADPLEPEVLKLVRKQIAGARFAQTQAVFDMETVDRFLDMARDKGVTIPILIGLLPLRSFAAAEGFDACVPGVSIPEELMDRLRTARNLTRDQQHQAYDAINLEFFGDLLADIRKTKAAGAHIMAVGYEDMIVRLIEAAGV
ncbi:MAG: methylenetetrahydrofolate reductase [Candidatus Undinarchaeales archaeon]|jgi:methylenetetrahydrofolate reductase (NADPH)|nr:methylenetetrahydrofolate reductase [Candidatus Undinarchaeales archaeon]MDP7492579.1 methylenetetrahydrofolate reductase [Candidatus Undinarchaeales archaeon]